MPACGASIAIAELAGQALDVGIFGQFCGLQDVVKVTGTDRILPPLTADPTPDAVCRRRVQRS